MKNLTAILSVLILLTGCATDDPDRELMRPDAGDAGEVRDDDGGGAEMEVDGSGEFEDGGDSDEDAPSDEDGGSDDGLEDVDMPPNTEDMTNNGICRPNRDGVIRASEVPLEVGLSAKFMVAEDVTFDTAGTREMGERVWDLSRSFDGDHLELTELRDPAGEWFETTFPDATYFTTLSSDSDLYGVFEITDEQLLLLGVVSPDDGFFRTELEYDPAVPVLQFPLEAGAGWSVETDVTGTYDGTAVVYDEVYDFDVDAEGVLKTAFGNFQVLRVRSTLDRQVGLVNTVVRSFAFVTECFGTVANVTSTEDEEEREFTDVAELRRIAP